MMNGPNFHIVIPARLASQRLPRKVLLDLGGQPMIQRVWNAARKADALSVTVATDDQDIYDVVKGFGGNCVMTSKDHESGSDRIAECASTLGIGDDDIIVNLQGDEPFMPATCLNQVAQLLDNSDWADVATLYWPIEDEAEVNDPNAVKVVLGGQSRALYFSRSVIPHVRGDQSIASALNRGVPFLRHLGLYAYRFSALKAFSSASPSVLEQSERLEQLRFLEMGKQIIAEQAAAWIPPGIDGPGDLEMARSEYTG